MWARRHLSLIGKCLVAKTFLLSKLNYIIQSLALPVNVINTIDEIIFKFLWTTSSNKKGKEKLKRDTLCLDKNQGGVGMISIRDQQESFLIKSLHKIKSQGRESQHFNLVNNFLNPIGGIDYFLLCNIDYKSFLGINKVRSHYWRYAMVAWLKFRQTDLYAENEISGPITLFNNKQILFKNIPLCFNYWIKNGIKFAHDLITEGRLKTYEELRNEIGPSGSLLLDFFAIKNAILKSGLYPSIFNPHSDIHCSFNYSKIKNKWIRNSLLQYRAQPLKCISTWERKLDIDITRYFAVGNMATKEVSLRFLHYRIIHHIFPTNKILEKMKVKENNKCDNCTEMETLEHLFFCCPKLTIFWNHISKEVSRILEKTIEIDIPIALFGLDPYGIDVDFIKIKKANYILLLAKACISKHKFFNSFTSG